MGGPVAPPPSPTYRRSSCSSLAVDAVGEVVAVDDEVDVTVAEIDLGARRIGFSTVERATEAPREGAPRHRKAHLATPDDTGHFGMLADLLRRRDPPG